MSDSNCIDLIPRRPQTLPSWREWAMIGLRKLAIATAAGERAMFAWMERYQQRRALARLDERMLKDIGIGGADVWQEARKQPWQS